MPVYRPMNRKYIHQRFCFLEKNLEILMQYYAESSYQAEDSCLCYFLQHQL